MRDSGGHAAPARILVVDDDPSIRFLCRVNLELDGYEVLEANSLERARESLEEGDVAVVLLDVHLQGERSDALLAECRALHPPVPVVIVTGSADVTQERVGEADAVLPKPFELSELLSTVRRLAHEHAHR
jgi:DNA-binding NtrC family response regulator